MNNSNNNGDINVTISAGIDKIKYYECDDNNCIFEILDDNQDSILNDISVKQSENVQEEIYDFKENNEEDLYNTNAIGKENDGEIIVTSILDCGEHEYLQGVKINLYKINGLSPVLIDSKVTDEDGKVIFSKVENGSYRIIELVDKRYFEKPQYIKWNEITIDFRNKEHSVIAVNRVKRFSARSRYN